MILNSNSSGMKIKTIIISILIFSSVLNIKAQDSVRFVFNAEHICTYIELDSIKIENITQGRDTILYYPDTVLNYIIYDIDNLFGKTHNQLNVAQNFPNPFNERTRINILVPEADNIIIEVSDLSGRRVTFFEDYFEPGIHEFDFYAGSTNLYALSVISSYGKDDIKMLSLDKEYHTNSRLEYVGSSKIVVSRYFLYDRGDDLRFTGYATPDEELDVDTITTYTLLNSDFLFTYENEVPELPSPIEGVLEVCEDTPDINFSVDSVEGVNYTWIVPDGWELIDGQGTSGISVNVGTESGMIYVIPSNTCGAGEAQLLAVYVQPKITPLFNQLGPYCQGEIPDLLPEVSINGMWGSWDSEISTDEAGYNTYTFTADDACENQGEMEIRIDEDIIPFFDSLGPYCQGHMPDNLPTVSVNGVEGTWNTHLTTYEHGTTEYYFTASNACNTAASIQVIVIEDIIPVFDDYGPYCVGAIPDILPDTSLNEIIGSWDSQIITTVEGTLTYVFTADNVCESQAEVDVLIDPLVEPEFLQLGPYCVDDTPDELPEYSLNGIYGTWDAVISTSSHGFTTYTFTAADACESETTMDIEIVEDIEPLFDQLGPYCVNEIPDVLPTTSNNGIEGTWDSPVSTFFHGVTTYTFTASNACQSQATMDVTVEEEIIPIFNSYGPYCVGETPDILPDTSLNGIDGSWNSQINTTTEGTTTYTFTADNTCATQYEIDITVDEDVIPLFNSMGPYCMGESAETLPVFSLNGISGSWDSEINTSVYGTSTYTFTADNTCQSTSELDIYVIEIPDAPEAGTINPEIYSVEWNWLAVDGASGYRYNTINDLGSSVDNLNSLTYFQTGLICEQDYVLYVWAYNTCETSEPIELNASTEDYSPYSIGDTGPAGGLIFYDKGVCSEGWRYLEAAIEDIEFSTGVYGFPWGCWGTFICGTSAAIGSGDNNTEIIINACLEPVIAATAADEYEYSGYTDWFLPSRGDMNEMFDNLFLNGWGNFASASYWTSTEDLANDAWMKSFPSGFEISNLKADTRRVRAIRKF
jgi:hypothetical protein